MNKKVRKSPEQAFKDLLTKYPDAEILWQAAQDSREIICSRAYTRQAIAGKGKYLSSAKQEEPITLLTTITSTQTMHYELNPVKFPDAK